MVNQESQPANWDDQELHPERVVVSIVSSLELQVDEVHSGVRASDVDDLKGTSPKHEAWILAGVFMSKNQALTA